MDTKIETDILKLSTTLISKIPIIGAKLKENPLQWVQNWFLSQKGPVVWEIRTVIP